MEHFKTNGMGFHLGYLIFAGKTGGTLLELHALNYYV